MKALSLKTWITVLGAGAALLAGPASAQDWPKKQPLRIIVPVPAGGTTDALARVTADFLQRRIGQAVIVENRPGASSTIGADAVAKSPPDGYTLLLTGAEFSVVPATRAVPYRIEDMTYLIRPFTVPPLMIANPKLPHATFPDLLAAMKANPGQVRYGSTGIGAIVHVGMAMFEGATGTKLLHVPYSGIAPVFNDLLSGTLDISESTPPFPETLKVLASAGTRRSQTFPNAPTLEEYGVKGASWDVWFGIMAAPGTPREIADRLIAELTAVYKDPEAVAKFQSTIKTAPDTSPLVGTAFRQQTLEDNKRWKAVVDREKIVVQ